MDPHALKLANVLASECISFQVDLIFLYLAFEEIVNSYFLHNNLKSLSPFMSSEIKIDQNGKRRFFSCYYHSSFSIQSA